MQKNAVSVCEVLQNAMQKLYGTRPDVKGCSRTDAGVHALAYCASYHQPKPIEPFKLPLALNQFLPSDIRVTGAVQVSDDFHARYSAVSKEYKYHIRNSHIHDVFTCDTSWRLPTKLDVDEMQKAAILLCGKHDYAAFMSAGSKITDSVRTVHFFNVSKKNDDITLHICADGYLYNMVRILVGTLVEVGAKRLAADDVVQVLNSKSRKNAGDTAPANGLFLYRVNY